MSRVFRHIGGRRVLVGVVAVWLAAIALRFAIAQSSDTEDVYLEVPVIRHEPVPAKRGLVGAPSDEPAVLIESSGAAPVADSSMSESSVIGEDIVYRTRKSDDAFDPTTVQNVRDTIRPDVNTEREPWLNYHAVFDPAIVPFKRNSAKDKVLEDGGIVVDNTTLRTVLMYGNRAESGREVFYGSILVDFEPNIPVPIPSVSPESNLLDAESTPRAELTFLRDGADNLYVSATAKGRVRLNYTLDAPTSWFTFKPNTRHRFDDIPESLRPVLPQVFQKDVRKVTQRIGVKSKDDYATTLRKLIWWFRSFRPGELTSVDKGVYLALALSRRGVCRHRVYAFVITAHGLGIPARYVSNEAHVFAEVYVPRQGWLRIDLGGGAQGMNVRGAEDIGLHAPTGTDPWGYPDGFRFGYSQRAFGQPGFGGEPVRGLPDNNLPVELGDLLADENRNVQPRGGDFGNGGGQLSANNRRLKKSRTTLAATAASVFRGEVFEVTGHVNTLTGAPIPGGLVRVQLMDMALSETVQTLGHTRTNDDGTFQARVKISRAVAPGQWQLIAEFLGDGVYGPSRSD